MKNIIKTIFIASTFSNFTHATVTNQEFIDLAKKTRSVFSGNANVDANNSLKVTFETLLTNQKVYLSLSASKLNSSVYTLINSDANIVFRKKSLTTPPVINVYDLKVEVDSHLTSPSLCNGSDVVGGDTSCAGKSCTITQRVISQCNADDCWESSPSTDRDLTSLVSEPFKLKTAVEITSCIPSNIAGQKHELEMTVQNESTSLLRGGSVHYSLILQNDVSI